MSGTKSLVAVVCGLAVAAVFTPAAFAEERSCRGTIGVATVDNLRVPPSAVCTLTRTYVKGTITVERGATLVANRVIVIGNVQAEGARRVTVRDGSRVGGSIQVKQGGGARVVDSRVTADIQFVENASALVASRNRVGGSIQAFSNRGGVTIAANVVTGNLQCKSNVPAPVGSGNIVRGSKQDQCARL
jgi:hypothetical protein